MKKRAAILSTLAVSLLACAPSAWAASDAWMKPFVLDGPAPVPFVVIRDQVRSMLGYRVGVRRLDQAIDRLVADGLLAVVREAAADAGRCRVYAVGPRLVGGGVR